ncbi:toluate 1,2-dioxygenase subunit alpha [Pseudoalteromonas sp. BSi20311]|uniref:Rieske 2Fe-2S domain-containing protein n=1 Tax=Pseudoalteromonas sp. BSi20311 TaxID=383911 RepID=UPI0002318C3C|nr:Rieske 2Fe-2S domain-containing protein [Pseudoalteromonas sp. BSi20311]MAD76825.1 benzoate 1,2-dioxygenase large subunit [Rheinheimera sp.]GAA62431.1 toluate 1,2-dioxygenase subunit alpha [Pseudoalteromonas sp. BSi20311]|tara:strand:+ start:650 stop:2014 length:1365 start_codon:yes stop_codon:yes gene_type:complete
MINELNEVEAKVKAAIEVDSKKGIYRSDRGMFTDQRLFELEMKHIFEGNWVFLAHENQIPEIGDYFTTTIGRQPVLITRGKDGNLNAILNTCSHRGATLCRKKRGNKTSMTCPFHGWTFSNTGKLLKARDQKKGGYPDSFNTDGSHDLKKIARFDSYRGFLFGSLNEDVLPLSEHLGETTKVIDNIVDQAPEGIEIIRGTSSYTYEGNWKMTAENGADGYHVGTVHWNYLSTMGHRNYDEGGTEAVDARGWSAEGGYYSFDHGHMMLWTRLLNPAARPIYSRKDELISEVGEARADDILHQTRNLCLYPNAYLMEQFSTQIRVLRPISVDKTEISIYCFAPKGESKENRAKRLRQYEDFFNVSGMGTPDDLEEFKACQGGYQASGLKWNDMSRGAKNWLEGGDHYAEKAGLKPISTGTQPEDEGLYILHHQHWVNEMLRAIEKERALYIPVANQ